MKLPNSKLQAPEKFQASSSNAGGRRLRHWSSDVCSSDLLGAWNLDAIAQPLSNLVFTVGTTIQDASLNNWSYVLLGAPEPQLLAGKRFAVFSKNGFPTNSGTFTLRGTIFQQTDVNAINTLLNQSVVLGDDLTSLGNSLRARLEARIPSLFPAAVWAFSTKPPSPPPRQATR